VTIPAYTLFRHVRTISNRSYAEIIATRARSLRCGSSRPAAIALSSIRQERIIAELPAVRCLHIVHRRRTPASTGLIAGTRQHPLKTSVLLFADGHGPRTRPRQSRSRTSIGDNRNREELLATNESMNFGWSPRPDLGRCRRPLHGCERPKPYKNGLDRPHLRQSTRLIVNYRRDVLAPHGSDRRRKPRRPRGCSSPRPWQLRLRFVDLPGRHRAASAGG